MGHEVKCPSRADKATHTVVVKIPPGLTANNINPGIAIAV